MIVLVGLVLFAVALIAAVAGVLGNAGHSHSLVHGFSVFGYHVTGSTGTLFLYGVVVGAIAMLGLSLLLVGARRTSRRGIAARRDLRESRRQTAAVSQDRDELIEERDEAVAQTAKLRGSAALRRRRVRKVVDTQPASRTPAATLTDQSTGRSATDPGEPS